MRKSIRKLKGRRYNKTQRNKKHVTKRRYKRARKRRTIRRGGMDGEKDKMKKRRKLPARPAPLTARNLELLNQGRPLLGRRLRKLPETPGTVKQYKTPEGREADRIGSHKPIHKRIRATTNEIYDINIKLDNHKYGTAPLSRDEVEELEASKKKKEKLFDDLGHDLSLCLKRRAARR